MHGSSLGGLQAAKWWMQLYDGFEKCATLTNVESGGAHVAGSLDPHNRIGTRRTLGPPPSNPPTLACAALDRSLA